MGAMEGERITVFLAETEGRGRGGENRAATDANSDAMEVADDTAAADSATTPDTMDGMDMGDAATPAP